MLKYFTKFDTQAEYDEAKYELDYPNVSIVASALTYTETMPTPPTPQMFSGLTVYYNISDASNEVTLFNGGGGSSSSDSGGGSSESGGGGELPTRMIVDGVEETPINTWRFETAGEHIVQYTFEYNTIPSMFLNNDDGVFNDFAVKNIIIGDDITGIPDDYADNGKGVFANNYELTSVTISDSVTSIGKYAFNNCGELESVTIPSGVTNIGNGAFDGCGMLQEVTIPNSVTNIGDGAFFNCGGLQSITILAITPPTFGINPFGNPFGPSFPIYVPADSLGAYQNELGDYGSRIEAIPQ